ncbi:hypothetical protein JKL49_17310 [Phenylobacterium sp. 20VBR1]|uniref:YbjN domain-containing protein n=1 Tax=Phenylobacterium glaciei TaxID=2803784 RepID=A0A941D2X0_9CAUL|nr:YbjN domain-containing protein [Phenylobacterium glaciei]MBR7621156.1 hypothetical protein [Phenylobacterium glaciei]
MRIATLAAAIAALAVAAQAATPAKPAAPKSGPFDIRDPAALVTLLKSMDAKAEIAKTEATVVFLNITTPGGDFGAQYVDCDAKGKACHALIFSTAFAAKGVSLNQINSFNQGQVACRAFIADDGKPNVAYATLVNLRMTTEEVKQHIGVWQGCLASFGSFTKPVAN